jgi:predicted CXXCH cytochrome family protein
VLVVAAGVAAALWSKVTGPPARPGASRGEAVIRPVVEDERRVFAAYAGSASCRECHGAAYELWAKSNHGLAERPLDPAWDRGAFDPPRRFRHGSQSTEARLRDGRFEVVTLGYAPQPEPYLVERVIGNDPLLQFLVPRPGGRWQTLEACWDPHRKEWFNVYGEEDRQPGEWGHWTGRGMNWNAMCAACHNTRLRKNYDEPADAYRTSMVEPTVGCEACHGPMKDHAQWRKKFPTHRGPDPTLRPMSRSRTLEMCGSCHARRVDLTGDFQPGDSFFDHYSLITVDETDTYYPDGQVRDEDYEFAAFLGSRMHKGGVWCLDCHQPHSAKTLFRGNDLCLRCHNGTVTNSPVIDPAAHGFHKLDQPGGLCTGCHMPITVYMARHPRHDHGFTIPDPLLTKQHGIPNACNRCHTDKDVDWALAAVEKWYGPKMDRYSRRRTQWLAAARQGEATARDRLLDLLQGQEATPYWKAVAVRLLERWGLEPPVVQAVLEALRHPEPLVRGSAARALERAAGRPGFAVSEALNRSLTDPARNVRAAAAWAQRATVDSNSLAGRDLQHMLDFNADQPLGQLQKGALALVRAGPLAALPHYEKAVLWDSNSAPMHHELAVVLSMMNRNRDALHHMQEACRLEPEEAEYRYKLALAWNEVGDLDRAVDAFEATVRLRPGHARALYNLGLARHAQGKSAEAVAALQHAESADPADPRIPYARATILLVLGQAGEARRAAARALELQPRHPEAEALLRQLER